MLIALVKSDFRQIILRLAKPRQLLYSEWHGGEWGERGEGEEDWKVHGESGIIGRWYRVD